MSDASFGKGSARPLSELSDRELEEELQRRRRLRAGAKRPEAPITDADRRMLQRFEREQTSPTSRAQSDSSWVSAATDRVDLARHYAALELAPGASLAQVESSYRSLMAKYHPDKHANDPDRHRAAVQLVQELGRAYQALSAHLRK